MTAAQSRILAPPPTAARSLTWSAPAGAPVREALARVLGTLDPGRSVVGLGAPFYRAAGLGVPDGLRVFPSLDGNGVSVASTQDALWTLLCDGDRGELAERARLARAAAGDALVVSDDVECFVHRDGRDLSGYVDGTENPKGDDAVRAAIVSGRGAALDGGSFVAVQRWVHDLARVRAMPAAERDRAIGRRIADDVEMTDAPPSAHVKRSAQESFDPPAFMVRRSLPWMSDTEAGLVFIAYGESLDRFERVLRRMVGLDDGVVDALFRFTRPVTGGYFWCPPAGALAALA